MTEAPPGVALPPSSMFGVFKLSDQERDAYSQVPAAGTLNYCRYLTLTGGSYFEYAAVASTPKWHWADHRRPNRDDTMEEILLLDTPHSKRSLVHNSLPLAFYTP